MGIDRRRGGTEESSQDSNVPRLFGNILPFVVRLGPTLSLSGIVILAVGAVVLLAIPDLKNAARILIGVAIVMLGTSIVTHTSEVKSAIVARSGRYAANSLVMVVSLGAMLILVGYISFQNSIRMDLTATRQFTLAPQTLKIINELNDPIKAIVYSNPEDSMQEQIRIQADNYFFEFNRRNRKFTFEFVDPDRKPSLARRDGVKEYPTIVFKKEDSKTNPYLLTPTYFGEALVLSEQDLVSALLIATGQKQKTVYMVTGHGEKNIDDSKEGSDGFGLARAGLLGDNYLVRSLNLKQAESVPKDAAAIIVAGPTGSILQDERDKMENYLRQGGRAMFLLDDAINTQMNQLVNKWGVNLPKGVIIDEVNSTNSDPRSPIIRRSNYLGGHDITRPLDDTFFVEATGIEDIIERAPEGLPPNPDEIHNKQTPLAATSLVSCITQESDALDCSDKGVLNGPFSIATTVEAIAVVGEETPQAEIGEELTTTYIVIFGDSDFATNKYYRALNNADFFLNAVDWLTQKYDLISIRAKPQAFRQLVIDQKEFDFIRYSSWFLLPSGLMLFATIAWWRRR